VTENPAGDNQVIQELRETRALRRQQGRLARRLKLSAALLLLVGLVVGGGWLLFASPYLTVEKIKVRGAQGVKVESVVAAAQVDFGEPLALVPAGQVAERVGLLDRVAEVSIVRGWPNELVIEIVERNPVAVTVVGDAVLLVDDQGVAYQGEFVGMPLPRVQALDDRARRAAVGVSQKLPDWISRQVAQTRASTPDDVTLLLRDGSKVVWGAPERAEDKIDVLRVLLRLPSPVYDVSAPDVPTVRANDTITTPERVSDG
jgi:cell division protein FtsQ